MSETERVSPCRGPLRQEGVIGSVEFILIHLMWMSHNIHFPPFSVSAMLEASILSWSVCAELLLLSVIGSPAKAARSPRLELEPEPCTLRDSSTAPSMPTPQPPISPGIAQVQRALIEMTSECNFLKSSSFKQKISDRLFPYENRKIPDLLGNSFLPPTQSCLN